MNLKIGDGLFAFPYGGLLCGWLLLLGWLLPECLLLPNWFLLGGWIIIPSGRLCGFDPFYRRFLLRDDTSGPAVVATTAVRLFALDRVDDAAGRVVADPTAKLSESTRSVGHAATLGHDVDINKDGKEGLRMGGLVELEMEGSDGGRGSVEIQCRHECWYGRAV